MNTKRRYYILFSFGIVIIGLLIGNATLSGTAQSLLSTDVTLGEPGTSYRYMETFGVSEVGYEDDSTHISGPYGIGMDGTSVWIADQGGNRAVKYSNSGTYQTQIGADGFQHGADGETLVQPQEVEVDSGGNVWIVDVNSHHILEFNSSGEFVEELGQEWNSGPGNDQFENPKGIAFDSSGNIYVSDVGNHRIQVFDSDKNYLTTLGETGVTGTDNDHFSDSLRHIAIDDGDLLYVADADNYRVQIFDVSATPVITFEATLGVSGTSGTDNDHFAWPMGVAINDTKIYVVDNFNSRVQVFNRSTHAYLSTIGGTQGTGDYEFHDPCDVAVDSGDFIYVADATNHRVQQFNSSETYLRSYGTTGVPYVTDGYHHNEPTGVAVADNGNIYLVEGEGTRLLKLNAVGVHQWTVGTPGIPGDDNSHFGEPQDVALDGSERVYVADDWNNRIQIFLSDGTYSDTLGTGYGSGDYEFNGALGVAVGPTGDIFVADKNNHRIQIYNSSLVFQTTLGETGVPGTDNAHFDDPMDVHVDSNGKIYVVERDNHRVQVYNSSLTHLLTIGETGVWGDDYGHFDSPKAVTVDSKGRIFVADSWGSRIQVFDSTGAYLTTISTGWGGRRGEMRNTEGLAVDASDNVYAADITNHRIQKYALGVPGWEQININGFGDPNQNLISLDSFGDYLYAGGRNEIATMHRTNNSKDWQDISPPWGSNNEQVYDTEVFGSDLYVCTYNEDGGELWRTDGSAWDQVVSGGFGDINNYAINALAVFSETIFAATSNYTTGIEIWNSSTGNLGSWSQVNTDGFGSADTGQDITMDVFSDTLYVGLGRENAELWKSTDGTNWVSDFTDGFGNSNNSHISSMAEFNGDFYIGLRNTEDGGEVYRFSSGTSTWTNVFTGGLGNTDNGRPYGLIVHKGWLYVVFVNLADGAEIWKSSDGSSWEPMMEHGWGDSLYYYVDYFDKGAAIHDGELFIATLQGGGKVWRYDIHEVFLPLILR